MYDQYKRIIPGSRREQIFCKFNNNCWNENSVSCHWCYKFFCRKECRQSNSTAYNIEWVQIFQNIKRIKRHSFERLGHSCIYSMGLPNIRSSHYTRNGIMFLQHLQRDDISLSDMEFEITDFRQADIGLIMPPYVSSLTQINSSNLNRLSNIVRLWRWR